jgi:hypothetical protein
MRSSLHASTPARSQADWSEGIFATKFTESMKHTGTENLILILLCVRHGKGILEFRISLFRLYSHEAPE